MNVHCLENLNMNILIILHADMYYIIDILTNMEIIQTTNDITTNDIK
jgi:hypothetical protein